MSLHFLCGDCHHFLRFPLPGFLANSPRLPPAEYVNVPRGDYHQVFTHLLANGSCLLSMFLDASLPFFLILFLLVNLSIPKATFLINIPNGNLPLTTSSPNEPLSSRSLLAVTPSLRLVFRKCSKGQMCVWLLDSPLVPSSSHSWDSCCPLYCKYFTNATKNSFMVQEPNSQSYSVHAEWVWNDTCPLTFSPLESSVPVKITTSGHIWCKGFI